MVWVNPDCGLHQKIEDAVTGQFLWQPALQLGQPDTLLGYPVAIWEQVDDIAPNAHPVGFGNFNRGYLLTDRVQTRIIVNNVTEPGFTSFYISRREGGCVLNNDAVKWLKTT